MTYAMILLNNVIGVLESDTPPSWPPDPQGNPVTAVECDESVELGMVYNPETGEFSEYIPAAYVPSQLDKIEEQVYGNNESNLIIMEAIADQYEQTEEYRLNDMEVQATIFESVLALSEGGTTV